MQPLASPSVRPGCLLFIIQATAAMEKPFGIVPPGDSPAVPKRMAAAVLVHRALRRLTQLQTDAAGTLAELDVAVLAYQAGESGQVVLHAPLAGATLDAPFLRLNTLALEDPAAPRLEAIGSRGKAAPADALAAAHRILRDWLRDHPGGGVPIVVHVTDGSGVDAAFARICRSLCALSRQGRNVVLLHCVLTEAAVGPVKLPACAAEVPAPWQTLWALSSPLVGDTDVRSRALGVNDFASSTICRLVQRLTQWEANETPSANGTTWRLEHRAFWLQKGGNEPDDWEDAFVVDAERGMAAVSDGAGSGIFSRPWADLVTRGLRDDEPSPTDLDALKHWVGRCRERWYKAIDLPSLRSTQRLRVRTYGTGATVLTLHVGSRPAPGNHFAWSAWAVGDSCLFWIRDNRLRATFPAVRPDDFGISTALLLTLDDRPLPTPLLAEKMGKAGDFFLLTTDAVGQMLIRRSIDEPQLDWEAFWRLDETAWRQEIAELRRREQIENDDCTLLVLRPCRSLPLRTDTLSSEGDEL